MAVTVQTTSNPGDLTFETLKQYAKDQLQDKGGGKGVRRQERVVNRALKYLASEKDWTWQRVLHRVLERPNVSFYDDCTMEAEGKVLTLGSGTFPSNLAQASFYFSGTTEVMKIATRDSAQQATMLSGNVWVDSVAKSNATGVVVYDRAIMPPNFKTIEGVPQERDFYKDLKYVKPQDWLYFRQSWKLSNTNPAYFTIARNPQTNVYELLWWPSPAQLRSVDMWIQIYPPELVNDADVALWNPAHSYALYDAIDLFVVKELRLYKEYPTTYAQYTKSVTRAKQADTERLPDEPAGSSVMKRNDKMRRSRVDIAV
jgi:hypothetical protein